jgi:hypothetical protein
VAFDLQTQLAKFLNDLYSGIIGTTIPIAAVRTGDGTAAAPAVSFASETGSGLYRVGAGDVGLQVLGVSRVEAGATFTDIKASDGGAYLRVQTGQVIVNGASMRLNSGTVLWDSAAPTVTSAGTSPSIVANGSASFQVNVGTGGVATTIVLAMPTATTKWNAYAENITGTAANRADSRMVMQSSTTNSLTLQYQTVSTGAAKAFTASDIVSVIVLGY